MDILLELASSSGLRDGMRNLRVEEKAADIMTSEDARGGGGRRIQVAGGGIVK